MHEDWTWTGNRRLLLSRLHVGHAVSLFWRDADDLFVGRYVDVLVPLRRSNVGFERQTHTCCSTRIYTASFTSSHISRPRPVSNFGHVLEMLM